MKQRILVISRVVWEQVVEPWVLRPAIARRKTDRGLPRPVVSCVFATAEAMFPLVALASRAMLSSLAWGTRLCNSAHYRIVEDAASAPSPRCLAWIIARRIRSSSSPSHNVDWGEPSTGIGRAARLARKKAREQVAVLRGLCMGGHLVMAQRFVENGLECWPVDLAEREGDKSGETLQGGKRFWALGEETTSTKEDEDEDSEQA
ncbi:hypothetical protein Pelo_18256 [Pelomyxa schiedti]|nr:hypothetical protein Pelo_18256 [Pelomyxa schiedti]